MTIKSKIIKIKDVVKGDYLLDKNGIPVLVEESKEFNKDEMFICVKGKDDGILRIGCNPKNAKVRKIANDQFNPSNL